MLNIIILGEEYWFEQPGTMFTEATFLLNRLLANKDPRFNYIIIKNPRELIKTINEVKNIRALFLFQDVISDCYLNSMTINEMITYLKNLIKKGTYIYPPVQIINTFASKRYNNTLLEIFEYASLPKTRVVHYKKYKQSEEHKLIAYLWKNVKEMWESFDKVVIKKGYSYEGKQVKIFDKHKITSLRHFKANAFKLNYKTFWGRTENSMRIDISTDRYYILQGFNKIITKRDNEYRVFFHNGRPKYIAKGDDIPNTCTKDCKDTPLLVQVLKFAKKLYQEYISLIWKFDRLPILFRIDVSYALDPIFQDQYSIKIDGFDTMVRLYANELEIDPTSFFYNKFICNNDPSFSSQKIQENMAKYINKYIKSLP